MKCWKYHGVFPRCWASLPSLLGNVSGAVLGCWGYKLHPPLQRIPTCAPGKDLHPAAYNILLSQGYCCDSRGFLKVDPCCSPSHSPRESVWMPCPAAAISAFHRLPPDRAPDRSRKHPEPCIAHRETGAGLRLRTTYLSALNVSTQVIYSLSFSTICHRPNDLQTWVVSSPRGLYPAGKAQDGETLHWEVYCSFSQGKGLEGKEKRSL